MMQKQKKVVKLLVGLLVLLCLCLGGCSGSAGEQAVALESAQRVSALPGPQAGWQELVRQASVEIIINDHLMGSGWLASPDGLVVTAQHVINSAPDGKGITVISPVYGRLAAYIVAVDCGHDLALLQVVDSRSKKIATERNYHFLRLSDKPVRAGDKIYVYGAPEYRHGLLLAGTVARQKLGFEWYGGINHYSEIYYVAAMAPKGVSGGPWVNDKGRVVGDQSGVMLFKDSMAGIAFVSPADAIRQLLRSPKTVETATLAAPIEEVWEQPQDYLKQLKPGTTGVMVHTALESGALQRSGLQSREIILAFDSRPVTYRDQLLEMVRQHQPGDIVELTVLNPASGQKRTVTVTLDCLEKGWK